MNPDELFNEADKYVDLIADKVAPIFDLLGLDKDQVRENAHAKLAEVRDQVTGHRDPAGGVRLGDEPVEPVTPEPKPEPKYPPFEQMVAELKAHADEVWGVGNHGWAEFNPSVHDETTGLMRILGHNSMEAFIRSTYKRYLSGEWPKGDPRGM